MQTIDNNVQAPKLERLRVKTYPVPIAVSVINIKRYVLYTSLFKLPAFFIYIYMYVFETITVHDPFEI